MRVLLIGFGAFPGAPFNPSAALVKALARRRRPALADVDRAMHVFPTTYLAVDRGLPKLLAQQPDVVLMFGLAGRTRYLRVETRARNAVSVLFPDASGYRPRQRLIASGAPAARQGFAPFARLVGAARRGGMPTRLSRDAGRYLCNYAYWRALERADRGRPLIQFVHVPNIRLNRRPRRSLRSRTPSLPRIIAAAEALLLALIAASRR